MAASFSQALSTFVIPAVEGSDPESVRFSLVQAHAELGRGAVREALRLLRKAAESSDEAGDDLRALALARAAADLATEVGPTAVPPPPPPAPLPPPAVSPALAKGESPDAGLQQLLETGRAVRVVVKRSAREDGLYIVRRAEDQPSAPGTRDAVLLLVEPDEAFFAPSKS